MEHDCNDERGIGYYLEGVMALAPFSKVPFHLTLRGVTNNNKDPSVSSHISIHYAYLILIDATRRSTSFGCPLFPC